MIREAIPGFDHYERTEWVLVAQRDRGHRHSVWRLVKAGKKLMRQPTKQEQQEWYQKLKDSGFKDIEYGRDLNQSAAQTFRQEGKPGTSNEHYMLWDFQRMDHDGDNALDSMLGWDGDTLETHPRRERARRLAEYAFGLTEEGKTYTEQDETEQRIILACIDMPPREAAKMLDIELSTVKTVWAATLERLQLPPEHNPAHVRHEPEYVAPVRSLSKREIAKLDYTPPRKMK